MQKIKQFMVFILKQLKRSVHRFKEPLAITMVLVILAITRVHLPYNHAFNEWLERAMMVFALGLPVAASLVLASERGFIKRVVSLGLTLVFLAATYIAMPTPLTQFFFMKYAALNIMAYMTFLLVPFFYQRQGFSRYLLHLIGRFFLTALYALVIFGGTSMMVFTVGALFEVRVMSEIYADLFICVSGFFGVTFFLGSIPDIGEELPLQSYSKIFKSLFLYILIPIMSVYAVILYAYFVKILFAFQLPQNMIGNLVLWHAVVSLITLFFIQDLKEEHAWLKGFITYYVPIMVVPLVMFFLAMGIRVHAFGLTLSRYYGLALGIYVTLVMAIMWFKRKDTAVIAGVLAIIFVGTTSFGYVSGYHMSLRAQNQRLEQLLLETGIKNVEGDFSPQPGLDADLQHKVIEQVRYVTRMYDINDVKALPSDFDSNTAEVYLGFKIYGYYQQPNRQSFQYQSKEDSRVKDVRGYDFWVSYSMYDDFLAFELADGLILDKTRDDKQITLTIDDKHAISLSIDELYQHYDKRDDLYIFEDDHLMVKAILKWANGETLENGSLEFYNYEVDLFVKRK